MSNIVQLKDLKPKASTHHKSVITVPTHCMITITITGGVLTVSVPEAQEEPPWLGQMRIENNRLRMHIQLLWLETQRLVAGEKGLKPSIVKATNRQIPSYYLTKY